MTGPNPQPAPLTADLLIDLAMFGQHRTLFVPPDQEQRAREMVEALGVGGFVAVTASPWLPDAGWYLAAEPARAAPTGQAVGADLDAVVRDFVGGAPTAVPAPPPTGRPGSFPDWITGRFRGRLASIGLNPVPPGQPAWSDAWTLPPDIDDALGFIQRHMLGEAQTAPAPNITTSGLGVLADIDAATEGRCACGCRAPITDASPSAWFADPDCQRRWSERHATRPGEVYARADAAVVWLDDSAHWRPDLATSEPRRLEPVDASLGLLLRRAPVGPNRGCAFGWDPAAHAYVLRLDDGHRYVEMVIDEGAMDAWFVNWDIGAAQDAWERLDRQLADPRLVDPDDPDHAIGDPDATPPTYTGFSWLYEHATQFAARLTEREHAAGRLPAGFAWTYEPTPTEGT